MEQPGCKHCGRHVFQFDKNDNGGEALVLVTDYWDAGDGKHYTTQQIELNSYGNSASINMGVGKLTAAALRKLANELDVMEAKLTAEGCPPISSR